MAKELPYFKFFPAEWVKGDVTICSMSAQGLFSNICTYYWMKDCNMSLTNVQHRFNNYATELEELFNKGIIKKDKEDNILIDFLDEQMSEFVILSEKRSKAGKSSGISRSKKKTNKCSTSVQQKGNYKEKDIEKIKIEYIKWFEDSDDEVYRGFIDWLLKNKLTHVFKLDEQITEEWFKNIRKSAGYDNDKIKAKVDAMEAKTDLLKNYKSFYRTLNNWVK